MMQLLAVVVKNLMLGLGPVLDPYQYLQWSFFMTTVKEC